MNGTLRSWVHYIQLRTDKATQKEHREVAQEITEILCSEFPSLASTIREIISANYEETGVSQ
jgi:thymidylate synthase (FAD)